MKKKNGKKLSEDEIIKKYYKAGIDDITIFNKEDYESLPDISDDEALDILVSKVKNPKNN